MAAGIVHASTAIQRFRYIHRRNYHQNMYVKWDAPNRFLGTAFHGAIDLRRSHSM